MHASSRGKPREQYRKNCTQKSNAVTRTATKQIPNKFWATFHAESQRVSQQKPHKNGFHMQHMSVASISMPKILLILLSLIDSWAYSLCGPMLAPMFSNIELCMQMSMFFPPRTKNHQIFGAHFFRSTLFSFLFCVTSINMQFHCET